MDVNVNIKNEAEEVRAELAGLRLASEAAGPSGMDDVKMEQSSHAEVTQEDGDDDMNEDDDEDNDDESYQNSEQSYSEDDIEHDDDVVDELAVDLEAQVGEVVQSNKYDLVEAARQGDEVDDAEVVASTAETFHKLSHILGVPGEPVTPYSIMVHLAVHAKEILDEKRTFAWFDKLSLIESYLTICSYAGTADIVLTAIADNDVMEDGKVVVPKLATALRSRALE